MDEMDEIVQEFVVESHENLDQLDRDFVQLEREPGSRELLASVFRTIHTIKGTSGFLAFSKLESLTHVGENLLARLRDGKMTMTPTIADGLLAMVDSVREILTSIEADGTEGVVDVSAVVDVIQQLLDGTVPEAHPVVPEPVAQAEPQEPHAEPEPEPAATVVDAPPPAPPAPLPHSPRLRAGPRHRWLTVVAAASPTPPSGSMSTCSTR